jgi:hypothetical protein
MGRDSRPLSRRSRRTAVFAGALVLAVAVGWVVTLPMRQTRFQVVEHRLESSGSGLEVRGLLRNRGDEAREVLVEAYLYDAGNHWLGTAQATLPRASADSTVRFAIPVEPRLARVVERYSLYAGVEPNPFAPGM